MIRPRKGGRQSGSAPAGASVRPLRPKSNRARDKPPASRYLRRHRLPADRRKEYPTATERRAGIAAVAEAFATAISAVLTFSTVTVATATAPLVPGLLSPGLPRIALRAQIPESGTNLALSTFSRLRLLATVAAT